MHPKQASTAWLWNNELLSDVQLRLSTVRTRSEGSHSTTSSGSDSSSSAETAGVQQPCVSQAADRSERGTRPASSVLQSMPPTKVPRRGTAASAAAGTTTGATAAATTAAAAAATGAAAAAGLWAADEAAVEDSTAHTFHLHACVLASSSEYFRTRITRFSNGGGGDGLRYADAAQADGSGDQLRKAGGLLLVEHVEEGELHAMEAMLRHCYTSRLCANGDAAVQLSVSLLLQMLALSDRFDMPACVEHCCEELARREPADYEVDHINAALGGLSPGVRNNDAFQAIAWKAQQRLLQLLGDADAVCDAKYCDSPAATAASQLTLLRQLSLTSLLALLRSRGLTARSENSVLMMATEWVTGSAAAAACGAAELHEVAATLRLGRLSHAFLFDVLPQLPWVKLSGKERRALLRFVAAGTGPSEAAAQRQHCLSRDHACGPAAWFATVPREPSPGGTSYEVRWEVTEDMLAAQLAQARLEGEAVRCSRFYFFAGFLVDVFLNVRADPGNLPFIGHRVFVAARFEADAPPPPPSSGGEGGGGEAALWPYLKGVESLACKGVHSSVVAGVMLSESGQYADSWQESVGRTGEWRLGARLSRVPINTELQHLDIASWAPYLVNNTLHVRFRIFTCS